ncbi:hypothetical protein Hanom_Chr14g01252931 [Helianthus anomalus]
MESHLKIDVHAAFNDLEVRRAEKRRIERERRLAKEATQRRKSVIEEVQEAGGSSSQVDIEMVDAEADPLGFVLVGESSESLDLFYILHQVYVLQKKKKSKEVMFLKWREEEEVEEETPNFAKRAHGEMVDSDADLEIMGDEDEEEEEEKEKDKYDNEDKKDDKYDNDDKKMMISKKHLRLSPEKEFEPRYAHEADHYNDVIVEDASDSSDKETDFHYSGVDETFPSFAEMFKDRNEDEIRRKVVEKVSSEGVPDTIPREKNS